SKEIDEQPISNALQALQGRVPGMFITQSSGVPGSPFTVQIRGINSVNGNDPFYIVDGVPYASQLPSGSLNTLISRGSLLNFLNPYDIESIEVLKDADATAIYGSRAANGAVLITTKRGKEGKMRADVNVRSGFTTPTKTLQLMN